MSLIEFTNFCKAQHVLAVTEMDVQKFSDYCRYFRRFCYDGGREAQTDVVRSPNLVENCFKILDEFYKYSENDVYVKPLQLGIQFIGNLVVSHSMNKSYIWIMFFQNLRNYSFSHNRMVRNYTEMAIYNLILDVNDVEEYLLADIPLLEQFTSDAFEEIEFGFLILEKFIVNNLKRIYDNIAECYRSKLLIMTRKCVVDKSLFLSKSSISFIKDLVIKGSTTIMNFNYNHELPQSSETEIMESVKIIGEMSCISKYKKLLQDDDKFISLIFDITQFIHQTGMKDDNIFSPHSKLEVKPEELSSYPLFGLKALLIRVIGNLCYGNQFVQNQVRKNGIIPVILDCCQYDAKNPYISQWAIFAVANLCAKNLQNQSIVQNLYRIDSANKILSVDEKIIEKGLTEEGNKFEEL